MMYDTVTIPSLIMSTSPSEHFEHTACDGKAARDIDACYQHRRRRDPHDRFIS